MRFFNFLRKKRPGDGQPTKINPPKIILLSFLIVILFGSGLLSLPYATADGKPMAYVDALFTATSATCVTGLIVKDTGADFSLFGQLVILFLIQIGGLGIMTLSTFFLLLIGRRMSIKDTLAVKTSLGHSRLGGMPELIKHAILLTMTFEFIGTAILFLRIENCLPQKAFYFAIFHAISGFCNAGFSLMSKSLVPYNSDPVIVLVMAILVVCGGLGFLVLFNIKNLKLWEKNRIERGRLMLQSRIVLVTSGFLLGAGLALFLLFEWSRAMNGMPLPQKLLNALFCSVTPRTAGFNTIDYTTLSDAGILLTMFLMFIGASPGSTGGGIKTCTFAVLLATSWAIIKGSSTTTFFKRTVSDRVVAEAIGVVALAMLVVFISALALLLIESGNPNAIFEQNFLTKILFEVLSAFGTVGLSLGITPYLSVIGKLIITVTMFVGRLGPLAVALVIARRELQPPIAYPEEPVMIG